MPLYDYACTECGHIKEVRHGFDESYEAPCEICGAAVRRVFNAAPVLFKGSGFYVTDSRPPGAGKEEKTKADATAKSDAKGDSKAKESAA
jgi:putative FmdB family regulatory protein